MTKQRPVLAESQAGLIRKALRKLGPNSKTSKVQQYVTKHFGITVKQPLICVTRHAFNTHEEDRRFERHIVWLKMLIKCYGVDGLTALAKNIQGSRSEDKLDKFAEEKKLVLKISKTTEDVEEKLKLWSNATGKSVTAFYRRYNQAKLEGG